MENNTRLNRIPSNTILYTLYEQKKLKTVSLSNRKKPTHTHRHLFTKKNKCMSGVVCLQRGARELF